MSDKLTLAPQNMAEAMAFANTVSKSSMVPKDFVGKPGNILVAIQMGMEVGLAPLQALQNIAVINGRPSLWGDAVLALVKSHPEFEDIIEMDFPEIEKQQKAVCTIKRKGQTPTTTTFTVEDAKAAKIWNKRGRDGQDTPWTTYPWRMLKMRARAFACRDAFPDALKGLSVVEEVMDVVTHEVEGSALERVKALKKGPVETEVVEATEVKVLPENERYPTTEELADDPNHPEFYIIKRGKHIGKMLGKDFDMDQIEWFSKNSKDAELKERAACLMALELAQETNKDTGIITTNERDEG